VIRRKGAGHGNGSQRTTGSAVLGLGLHLDAEGMIARRLDLIEQPADVKNVLPGYQSPQRLAVGLVPFRGF
jgi:hypothetical protein